MAEANKDYEKKWDKGERILKLVNSFVILLQTGVLLFFFIEGRIIGAKGVVLSLLYLVLSGICMNMLDASGRAVWHSLFMIMKILLAEHIFGSQILSIIITVVVMTAVNFLFKQISKAVIKKYGLYWHTPMGMG